MYTKFVQVYGCIWNQKKGKFVRFIYNVISIDHNNIYQKNQIKWRIRELIARQIDSIAILFDVNVVFKIVVPMTLKLCNDVVA